MPQIIESLKKASYRDVEFYYKSTSESSGFKVAEHVYPGSDNFNIEQLGLTPRRMTIEARVTFANRDSFDRALKTAGDGLLSHPMYGTLTVKVISFTKSDTVDDLGLYDYSVTFGVELGPIVPTLEGIGESLVFKARATLLDAVVGFVKNTFNL